MENKVHKLNNKEANSNTEMLQYLLGLINESVNNMKNKYTNLQDLCVSLIDESTKEAVCKLINKQKKAMEEAISLYSDISGLLCCPLELPNDYISQFFYRIDQLKARDFEITRENYAFLKQTQHTQILEFSPVASMLY